MAVAKVLSVGSDLHWTVLVQLVLDLQLSSLKVAAQVVGLFC